MKSSDLEITVDLDDHPAVTAPEMQLLADLLPELIKDLILLRDSMETNARTGELPTH